MKKLGLIAGMLALVLTSCDSHPSLQKYFVENSNNKEFIAVDIAPSFINVDKVALSDEEKAALKSFKKMNVLAFKADGKNQKEFETERAKVNTLLKDESYQELIKMGSGKEGGAIYFVGDTDHVSEFVLYGNKSDQGFAVVRILGDDMNPNHVMSLVGLLKKGNLDLDQLAPLKELMPKEQK
ncbi:MULTISPECIES: DUF4252 domain-containing protein [Flavobacterium]|uniref:DUF4252 domain-containing protein n=1 Tax=Flavobacterium TaxID=237 RepID=UPI00095D4574|nr:MULTISPECIES: DUF4252 domain-containing protein [Flavobacterium]MBN9286011.1 DUF4252 domain-containing protein [Flavobacterium sp.]OJV69066.1 MAG: hypothetical protein BGO42_05035 [Flavobacterium sp. 40-81]